MQLTKWIPVVGLVCATALPAQAQVRIEPVAGVLFSNYMPAQIHSGEMVTVVGAEMRRDAGALVGLEVEIPIASRVSLLASYGTARAAHSLSYPQAGVERDGSEGVSHVNLMSAQARVRVTPASSRLVAAVSAGPARVASGSSMFDIGGSWAAVAGAALGYRATNSVTILAHQQVFAYKHGYVSEREHTFRVGLSITP